ncbi:hypothetical protein QQ045_026496 [Rhodiola kirilowii]
MVEYPHTGDNLASHMYEELIAWHLHDKVFTLTLNNASSNDVLVSRVASHLMLTNVSNQLLHVRCTCHILNLIVQDGLSVLSPSIEKIITIVRSMNFSIKRHELWVSSCAELGLSKHNIDNDVPHRWNSTYELLNIAVKYKTAMHRYCQKVNESRNCSIDVPNEHDWADFPMIFCLTTVMDPRFKLLAIESWLSLYELTELDIEMKVASVRTVLHQLYDMYKRNLLTECTMNTDTVCMPTSVAREHEIDVNISVVPSASMAKLKRARVSISGASTDLQIYLDLDTLDIDDNSSFNVLEWWKANSTMYHVLSIMTKDLLSIPASTIASEAAFSAGGRVVSESKGFT